MLMATGPINPPAPELSTFRIQSRKGWQAVHFAELWHYRELFWFLTLRDVKVRYKQTVLGVMWAVIQPVVNTIIYTGILGRLAHLDQTSPIPYPVLTFTALLPWTLFANALTNSGNSLVGNERLVSKVYFPRLVIPVSAVLGGVVDFAIAFLILIVMMLSYRMSGSYAFDLRPGMLLLPLLLLMALAAALGAGLWLSALNVKYRDVRYVIPFITQVLFWVTPIGYPAGIVKGGWKLLYVGANPMTGVVEGFQWALLGSAAPDARAMALSIFFTVLLLVSGLYYFKRVEQSFADVI